MRGLERYNFTLLSIIIFAVLAIAFVILYWRYWAPEYEGFSTVPLVFDPNTKKILSGYYQVDANNMALVPYGYIADPSNPTKIIPNTIEAEESGYVTPSKNTPNVPKPGMPMPDGYYKISDSSLAILPPNMSPDLKSIDLTSDKPPILLFYYNNGYVSETAYYQKQFELNPDKYPDALPPGVYYTDKTKTKLSLLPYGNIADTSNGYGMIQDPQLNLNAIQYNFLKSNYRMLGDNYDTQFHDTVEVIQATSGLYDLSFVQVKVVDQNGNSIMIPKAKAQGNVTYYQPGEFPFGAATYVPNYEDSAYLRRIEYETAKYAETRAPSYVPDKNQYYDNTRPLHYAMFNKY